MRLGLAWPVRTILVGGGRTASFLGGLGSFPIPLLKEA